MNDCKLLRCIVLIASWLFILHASSQIISLQIHQLQKKRELNMKREHCSPTALFSSLNKTLLIDSRWLWNEIKINFYFHVNWLLTLN